MPASGIHIPELAFETCPCIDGCPGNEIKHHLANLMPGLKCLLSRDHHRSTFSVSSLVARGKERVTCEYLQRWLDA
jgi:hypothetical protein